MSLGFSQEFFTHKRRGTGGIRQSTPSMVPGNGIENYTLQITSPRSNQSSNHRTKHAYPGIPYEINVACIGGAFPYRYSLANEPSGMTINSTTGEISWPSPSGGPYTVTVNVQDRNGNTDSESWTITVGTSRFLFIDAVNGSNTTGSGSLASPWQTLSQAYATGGHTDIIYFRAGTYNLNGITTSSSTTDLRTEWDSSTAAPVIWLGYPGETVTLDFLSTGGTDYRPKVVMGGTWIYIRNMNFTNPAVKGFQINEQDASFTHLNFSDMRIGGNGTNAAFIGTELNAYYSGVIIQDCTFDTTASNSSSCLKMYWTNGALVERCTFSNTGSNDESMAWKQNNQQFTTRQCEFENIGFSALGGNWQDTDLSTHQHYGEFCFNLIKATAPVAVLNNQNNDAGPTHLYRNTLVGRVEFRDTSADDGPFVYENNVIVNSDNTATGPDGTSLTHFYRGGGVSVSWATVEDTNNLKGTSAAGILDANGLLQGSFRTTYLGTRGHEIHSSEYP